MKDPAAARKLAELWKEAEAHRKTNGTETYWSEHERIKKKLEREVNSYLAANLGAQGLLRLAVMQGRYRFTSPHMFVAMLSTAHDHTQIK